MRGNAAEYGQGASICLWIRFGGTQLYGGEHRDPGESQARDIQFVLLQGGIPVGEYSHLGAGGQRPFQRRGASGKARQEAR